MQRMPVPPARGGTHEDVLHQAGVGDSLLVFPGRQEGWLAATLGHRAIGVVYQPRLERTGNYVPTTLGRRYDAFCFLERTTALRALHLEAPQPSAEQETYPFGG